MMQKVQMRVAVKNGSCTSLKQEKCLQMVQRNIMVRALSGLD